MRFSRDQRLWHVSLMIGCSEDEWSFLLIKDSLVFHWFSVIPLKLGYGPKRAYYGACESFCDSRS